MRKGELRRGSFACPGCKKKLRWPEPSRLEVSAIGVAAAFAPFLVAYLLGAGGVNVLLYGLLLLLPLAYAIGAALGILRVLLFPVKLQRDAGWLDEGTILHITTPPDPPDES
jgi:hypothetical protein